MGNFLKFFSSLTVSIVLSTFSLAQQPGSNPGTTGTDRLRVKAASNTQSIQDAQTNAQKSLDKINQLDPENLREQYSKQTSDKICETENLYIESLYDTFVKDNATVMNGVFIHIRKKMNMTATHFEELTESAELLSQYKNPGENAPSMTVGAFANILIQYEKQLDESNTIDWTKLGITEENLVAGIAAFNRTFSASFNALENQSIYLGTEKPFARIYVKTRMGADPNWRTEYPNKRIETRTNSDNTWLATDQKLSVLTRAIPDEMIWKTIRDHKVYINGVPVDGQSRREHFELLRRKECWKTNRKVYRDEPVGPYVDVAKGKPCPHAAIHLITVSVNGQLLVDRSKYKTDDLTFKHAAAEGQKSYSITEHASGCGYVDLVVTYSCGCDPTPMTQKVHGKSSATITFNCPDDY